MTIPPTPAAVRALIAQAESYKRDLGPEGVAALAGNGSVTDWWFRTAAALEASLPREDAGLATITIRRPHVPHGPKHVTENEADADYLRSAAGTLVYLREHHDLTTPWGSNVTETVRQLLVDCADALLASRTVETAEELDALPIGSVVVDFADVARTKRAGNSYMGAGWTSAGSAPLRAAELANGRPMRVVHTPAPRQPVPPAPERMHEFELDSQAGECRVCGRLSHPAPTPEEGEK